MQLNVGKEIAAMEQMAVGQLRNRYAEVFGETKHFYFGHVHCPAVSGRFRKLQLWGDVPGPKMQRQFLSRCEIVVGYLFNVPRNS